ncbi:hypothetical protein IP88_05660, partial [alpha proteobacterium AAP81b]
GGSISLAGTTLNGGTNGIRSAVVITPPAAASTVTLGTVNARALAFAGDTAATGVTLGTATLVDDFTLTLTAGNFAGRVTVTNGDILVAANAGSVASTRLAASQAVTASGLSLDIDEARAGFGNAGSNFDATLTATNNFTAETVTATGDIRLSSTGGDLATSVALSAGDDIVLGAANGSITLGNSLTAGTADAQGDLTATAESLALGTSTLSATGLVSLTSTAGSLAGGAGLVITSNSGNAVDAGVVRALSLSATGGNISLAGTTLNGGSNGTTSAVLVTPPAAASTVTLGTVNARALAFDGNTAATDVTLGTATLVDDFSLTLTAGDFAGAITSDGSITLTADTGAINAGALDAGGSISLTATVGNLDATTLTAGADISLTATAGDLGITGALGAGDDVALSAANGTITLGGNVTAGTGNAQGDLTATAASLVLGNDNLAATGLVSLTATAGSLAGSSGLVITSNSGNAVDAGVVRALNLSATGGSISLAGTTLNG